ncbi:beta-1,3-glucosyltransferase-like [Patiria miniata]|uniref:Fringe-like glycosyltransferase domain-containing protein n=1 Tax=Patiria miniata TaxID=46514 RepID=A0A913ZYM8_PATMI|nr:beta-1,3-glucosyltransferase-like [Patiria miniata]
MAASIVAFVGLITGVFAATFDPYFPRDLTVAEPNLEGHHATTGEDLVFIIRSQQASPHDQWAKQVKADIEQQYRILNLGNPQVFLLHQQYEFSGVWTILPVLPKLNEDFGQAKWLFFCEEQTRVSVHGLLQVLTKYNPQQEWFLGRALQDRAASVIHHYRFHDDPSKFSYPDFEAGWLISTGLLRGLADRWETEEHRMDFSIDVKHELAYYILNDGNGTRLTALPALCAGNVEENPAPRSDSEIRKALNKAIRDGPQEEDGCVSAHPKGLPTCAEAVLKEDILFAVKTCKKFHKDRVPIVQQTWGKHTSHIVFVSDVQDDTIPTIASGVPNTERGHCGKLFAIFEMFNSKPEYLKYSWLVVADDDTILSVARLRALLSCYNAKKLVFLGERYGYGHLKLGWGYDYLTGGGGMIFSRAGIQQLLATGCKCNKDEDPDDMIFGMCTKRHDMPITHSPLFHQARPSDYAVGYLQHQTPVSFHKHLNADPLAVYRDWFKHADEVDSRTHGAQGEREEL